MKKILIATAFAISVSLVWGAWETVVFLNQSAGSSQSEKYFEVKKGESVYRVAVRLKRENLISDVLKFRILARLSQIPVRAGEYALKEAMFPVDILKSISTGRSVLRPFTVQEGLNIYEISNNFEKAGLGPKEDFLKLCHDKTFIRRVLAEHIGSEANLESMESLEGYLFPETYKVTKYTGAKKLIRNMVAEFFRNFSEVEEKNGSGLSRHEVVTLASIVEKETGAPEERRIVSSVYHNRLKKPMRLYADPTVLYGIWVETKKFKKNLTKKDLRRKTPYNTYTNMGLPKGPIANPGKLSLLAAVDPEMTDYYYFVSRNDGRHVFSTDYKSHKVAVRKYQLDRRQREGKSWRDLNKKKSAAN